MKANEKLDSLCRLEAALVDGSYEKMAPLDALALVRPLVDDRSSAVRTKARAVASMIHERLEIFIGNGRLLDGGVHVLAETAEFVKLPQLASRGMICSLTYFFSQEEEIPYLDQLIPVFFFENHEERPPIIYGYCGKRLRRGPRRGKKIFVSFRHSYRENDPRLWLADYRIVVYLAEWKGRDETCAKVRRFLHCAHPTENLSFSPPASDDLTLMRQHVPGCQACRRHWFALVDRLRILGGEKEKIETVSSLMFQGLKLKS